MEDLISKTGLYKKVEELAKEAMQECLRLAREGKSQTEQLVWQAITAERTAFKHLICDEPPAKQWTPCSEGFPEANDRYQVTFESGEVAYADFRNRVPLLNGSVKENVWETERYYEDDGEVIAWMPVPKPYKGEE